MPEDCPVETGEPDPREDEDRLDREETFDAAPASPTPAQIAKENRLRIATQNYFGGTPA